MAKTQVWTPEDGFTKRSKPKSTAPREQQKRVISSKRPQGQFSKQPHSAQKTQRSIPVQKTAPKSEKIPTPDATSPEELGRKVQRKLQWLQNNRIEGEYSIAEKYISKQIREKTPMIFHTYDGTLHCQIERLWKYNLNLLVDGKQQSYSKLRLACYYKERDAPLVEHGMLVHPQIEAKKLEVVVPRKDRLRIDDVPLKESAKTKRPIFVALRTGQLFKGYVRWFTPYEIRLIVQNGAKVHIFRHALYAIKTDAEVKGQSQTDRSANGEGQTTESQPDSETDSAGEE